MQCQHQSCDLSFVEPILSAFAEKEGALISILQQTQEVYGYLPIDALYRIAEARGLSPARVVGVATFYAQFRFAPMGKYLVTLCDGTACHVNGSAEIARQVGAYLGIENGGTTEDGLFTLSIAACLGCCSLSPVMTINEQTYGGMTPERALEILADIRKEEQA